MKGNSKFKVLVLSNYKEIFCFSLFQIVFDLVVVKIYLLLLVETLNNK